MIVIACILLLVGISVPMSCVGTRNTEIGLRNSILTMQKSNVAFYDTMWKTIQQQADVSNKYQSDFKEIYIGIMEARYGSDANTSDPLFLWIQERNPEFDASMYAKLMTTIESLRMQFFNHQERLLDKKREHDNLLEMFPSSMYLKGRDKIDVIIVTSSKTEDAFKSGKEDDIQLF